MKLPEYALKALSKGIYARNTAARRIEKVGPAGLSANANEIIDMSWDNIDARWDVRKYLYDEYGKEWSIRKKDLEPFPKPRFKPGETIYFKNSPIGRIKKGVVFEFMPDDGNYGTISVYEPNPNPHPGDPYQTEIHEISLRDEGMLFSKNKSELW